MTAFLDRLGLECPVVQAGMGGGISAGRLAGAVSAAGGLGTVGIMAPRPFAAALSQAQKLAPGRPVAANLLAPFIRAAHVRACIGADVAMVVIHGDPTPRWTARLKAGGINVFQTVGTPAEATLAVTGGADGLVVQGIEAGGHLVGTVPIADALSRVLEVAEGKPVLAAGGIAEVADVRRVLAAGAVAAVTGTRFLLTPESGAHEAYRQRVVAADRTIATLLFGFGWPMRHRVVPNAATERWCADNPLGPGWVRRVGRISAPLGRVLPLSMQGKMVGLQHPTLPIFTPALPLTGMPEKSIDRAALYAGETASRISGIIPAAEAVARLAP
ncbi:MAG: nitronate monooxygenase [Thermoleophilia bacterium]|nr:nitronate monooxygenase [Thermoleophilia bacterium]